MYQIGFDNKNFKTNGIINYNIEEVEMLIDDLTQVYYFRYKDVLTVCCGIWELNGGVFLFCSLRKLTLNEIDKIRNIYFKRKGLMF